MEVVGCLPRLDADKCRVQKDCGGRCVREPEGARARLPRNSDGGPDARPRVRERPTASAAIGAVNKTRRRALEAVSEYAAERRGYKGQARLKTRLYANQKAG